METKAAFELLETAPGLLHQHTLRRALVCASLGERPLLPHQVDALQRQVGVDERGFVSLERFNVRLSVLPAMTEAPAPGRCARCLRCLRGGKKERLAQYQEPVLDSSDD